MKTSPLATLTIGRLAKAAGVGIETIRYYQTRGLLPMPPATGSYRQYPLEYIDRIRFIKRAQELGFALDEIHELLQLDEHTDRKTIRQLATTKIEQIQQKLDGLTRMQATLQRLVTSCSHTAKTRPCPIIVAFSEPSAQG